MIYTNQTKKEAKQIWIARYLLLYVVNESKGDITALAFLHEAEMFTLWKNS